MRASFFLLFFLFLFGMSYPQEKISHHIYYEFKHVSNLESPQDTLVDRVLLLVGQESSLFLSYTKLASGYKRWTAVKEEERKAKMTGEIYELKSTIKKTYVQEHLLHYQKRRHIVIDYLLQPYWYESDFQEIPWEVTDGTKVILGVSCQSARANYRGREWVAWFAADIPIPMGPWLLYGLPGLILEAYDETGEVHFAATSMVPHEEGMDDPAMQLYVSDTLEMPAPFVEKISERNYLKLKQAARSNTAYFSRTAPYRILSEPIDFHIPLWRFGLQVTNYLDRTKELF